MYNIFRMIYSFVYYFFAKNFYKLQLKSIDKEIYNHNNKYLVVIKNNDIGNRLYNFFKSLKFKLFYPGTENIQALTLVNYGVSHKNRVKWFCLKSIFKKEWRFLTDIEKLIEIQRFVEVMESNGFILDSTKIDPNSFTHISDFFSLFIECDDVEKIKQSKVCMIKYIHYVLTNGGNLEEFYSNFGQEKVLWKIDELPYALPIVQMCYDYYKAGNIPNSIYEVLLKSNDLKKPLFNCWVLLYNDDSILKVTQKTDEYTIYNGCLKIYNQISHRICTFLTNTLSGWLKDEILEDITIVTNSCYEIIGYYFQENIHSKDFQTIQNVNLNSQKDIFYFTEQVAKYVYKLTDWYKYKGNSNDQDIEKCLMCKISLEENTYTFKLKTLEDLWNINLFYKQIVTIFLKRLAMFIEKKYGRLRNKKQFLEKTEIRVLNPILVREFINFALGKQVDYQEAEDALRFSFRHNKTNSNIDYYYDYRFNPTNLFYTTFEFEVEQKYGIKSIKLNDFVNLPDGRVLITFKKSIAFHRFENRKKDVEKLISKKIGKIQDDHVKFVKVSQLVLNSKRLYGNDMYNIIGYIVEPIKGERLTEGRILKFDNKTLLKVAAYLFTKFSQYYINFESIWMDNNFMFYINYMDEKFHIKEINGAESHNYITNSFFVKQVFDYLISRGYNPYAFSEIEQYTKQSLLDIANRLNKYCNEHKIYYSDKQENIKLVLIDDNKSQELTCCTGCPACLKTKYFVAGDIVKKLPKVFEDETAIHYSFYGNQNKYNLKVYKFEGERLNQIEKNIDQIIKLRLFQKTGLLQQNCFIPIYKAVDLQNNQFIGYVYESNAFDHFGENTDNVCIDLEDKQHLNNLARLKSLLRLVMQVKQLIIQKMGFIINPFGQVYLYKNIKRQVQILNIDFLDLCNINLQETEEWTIQYVHKVLKSDSTLEQEIDYDSKTLLELEVKLTNLARQMTQYCPIHKSFYNRKYLFCPKCISAEEQTKFIKIVRKSSFQNKEVIEGGEGGESYIYPCKNGYVAKVFKEEVDIDHKRATLARIFSKKKILEKINKENHKFKYVIPSKVLVNVGSNDIFGYIMNKVQKANPISILRDKTQVKKLSFSIKDILEIIITIGEGIETLHKEANIYIGDLNGRNILVDQEKNVYFIDFDGMGIDEIAVEFYTPGYIDPNSAKNQNITSKDDWYSYALQAFYYLTYTHPFNGIYYEEKSGKRVVLDIPEKMERRISLLGNHGMKLPEVAVSWEWMNDDLKQAFLNIFEGDYRESIVPNLKKQLIELTESEKSNNATNQNTDFYRINPKFIAIEKKIFEGEIVRIINPYCAICKEGSERYLSVVTKNNSKQLVHHRLSIDNNWDIKDVFISNDKEDVIITFYDLARREKYLSVASKNLISHEEKLYSTHDNYIIVLNGIIYNSKDQFNINSNEEIVHIRKVYPNTDCIFYNGKYLTEIEYNSAQVAQNIKYNIIYDDSIEKWLVLNSIGFGMIIDRSGQLKRRVLPADINGQNISNVYFRYGYIYIPEDRSLTIINIKNGEKKTMECLKIMTPESKIFNINSEGFSVMTKNTLYDVRRG